MIDKEEIKSEVLYIMRGRRKDTYLLFTLGGLLTFVIGLISRMTIFLSPLGFLWAAFYAFFLPIGYLQILRGDNTSFKGALINELEAGGWRYTLSSIFSMVFVFGWSLLFFIPGLIKQISYAMTPFILKDNPDIKALDAITVSRTMMRGNKWNYFMLAISYYKWMIIFSIVWLLSSTMVLPALFLSQSSGIVGLLSILSILSTTGITVASIMVVPRWQLAQAKFYEQLANE